MLFFIATLLPILLFQLRAIINVLIVTTLSIITLAIFISSLLKILAWFSIDVLSILKTAFFLLLLLVISIFLVLTIHTLNHWLRNSCGFEFSNHRILGGNPINLGFRCSLFHRFLFGWSSVSILFPLFGQIIGLLFSKSLFPLNFSQSFRFLRTEMF